MISSTHPTRDGAEHRGSKTMLVLHGTCQYCRESLIVQQCFVTHVCCRASDRTGTASGCFCRSCGFVSWLCQHNVSRSTPAASECPLSVAVEAVQQLEKH